MSIYNSTLNYTVYDNTNIFVSRKDQPSFGRYNYLNLISYETYKYNNK